MGNIYLKKLVELQEVPTGRLPLQSIVPLAAGTDAVVTGASGYSLQVYSLSFQAEAGDGAVVLELLNGSTPLWERELDKKTMIDADPIQAKAPWKLDVGNDLALAKSADVLNDVKVTVLYDLLPIA